MKKQRFGVMLDMSRNAVMKPEKVKEFATVIKSFGYNMIQLYMEDTYEVDGEPYFGYMRGRYTKDELKDIVDYCDGIGVEIIPCIQTLAHLNQIFRWSKYSEINDVSDILLVGDDKTYSLIENMFKTIKEVFKTNYVHIGMDEAHMLGHGKYYQIHGDRDKFEVLNNHLDKVVSLAKKYKLKPIMWSDMFFRLGNGGEYYPANPVIGDDVKAKTNKDVGLVYWDYYHNDKSYFDKMMKAHLSFDNEVWFAGGAWTWTGFASGNNKTLRTMIPAMESVVDNKIDNVLITMWGDNGKECSFYSVLPSLYAIRKYYEGEKDFDKIKRDFNALTGEDFDDMCSLDSPNLVSGNKDTSVNISKFMLYNDTFNGVYDSLVQDGVGLEYKRLYEELSQKSKRSKKYSYIFDSLAKLCNVLELKYDLGYRTYTAYKNGDKKEINNIVSDYKNTVSRLDEFYTAFKKLWYTENKPCGFDVQDLRIGGLKQRLLSCADRLTAYANGKIDKIEELEEERLCCYGGGKDFSKVANSINVWSMIASSNVI